MASRLVASAYVATLLALPVSALAQATGQALESRSQPGGAQELDAIVVTATRRSEKLQDVPLSVTVLGQEQLDAKGIVGYEGLAHETPGVVLNRPSANFNNFAARGIATNGYNANLQSTVAIYIDELPISANGNSTVLDPSLYDVERIEFLRGPQGTLFGSGSLAGALRILTHAPDPNAFDASFLADVGVTGSSSLRQRYNAMVNIPLAQDTMALRVVGFSRNEDGYIDNLGTGVKDANVLKAWGGRATAHAGDRGGPDHRSAPGRGHRGRWPGRCRGPGPRHALRPALALACRRRAGGEGARTAAVPALRAARGARPVRLRRR